MQRSFHLMTLLVLALQLAVPAQAADDSWVTVAQSQPLVAQSEQAIHTSQSINVPKGQDKLQLYMTYYDGVGSAPKFSWIRISSASMNFISEQQFVKQNSLTMNVSGEVTWGGNQLLVSAAGPKGATFEWVLRTPTPTLTGVSPQSLNTGSNLTISGTNLCPNASNNQVWLGDKVARIISASAEQIVVEVPDDSKSGPATIKVATAGLEPVGSSTQSVNIVAQPYLSSLSQNFVAPANPFTITGEGFSSDMSKIQVWVGQFQAQIVTASPTSLTVICPSQLSDPWYAANLATTGAFYPVRVIVNGVKARNTISIRAGDVS
jgi:hypothetical protein